MGQLYLTFKKVAVIFRQWRKFFSLTRNFYEVLISGPMTQGCSLHGAEDPAWHFTVLTHSWSVCGCPHTATAASVTNFSYSLRRHLALPDICCHPPWKPLFRFCCFCPDCWFLSVCFMSMFVCHSPLCWEYCVRTWFSSPIMRVPETKLGGSLLGGRHLYLVSNTLAAPSVFRRVQTDAHAMAAFLCIFTSYQISTQHHLILLNSYTILYSLNIT